jgi:hypothetical protein
MVSQTNYTLSCFAQHSPSFSHDAVKRYLEEDKLTARMVWEQVRGQVVRSEHGYLAFDDGEDRKSQLDHVRGMLDNAFTDTGLPFRGILMRYRRSVSGLHAGRLRGMWFALEN